MLLYGYSAFKRGKERREGVTTTIDRAKVISESRRSANRKEVRKRPWA